MSSFEEKRVLITGGAQGIGLLMASESLESGSSKVIIWDIDADKLEDLKQASRHSDRIDTYAVDVSNTRQIDAAAQKVLEKHNGIDILINNAGIVVGKNFEDHTVEEISRTMAVNAEGVMQTTRAFLPAMIGQGSGHIVNIASAAGMMANPGMSVYVGSKWAVSGWSESLRLELESLPGEVRVTTVQPGFIDTGMFKGVKAPFLTPILKPGMIAQKIIRAVQQDKKILREPFMVKLIPFLKGVLPTFLFHFVAGKLFRVYESMNTFEGRT